MVWGDILVVTDGPDGINFVNISNPRSPVFINRFDDGGWTYSVKMQGNIVVVADGFQGVELLNITNLLSITKMGAYGNTYNNSRDIALSGNTVFIADRFDGIEIVNIANPSFPVKIGPYHHP